ncbi:c-type cytochrome biogenesis protein CcmI [Pseudomonas sp. DTU_2021_1001937_2_SI_NGA_ILE_001]|uniref:c-type cytochrome biogenesis protein CcmI n=1 Tax=Pseudomonas sp. DTU_2021_1001937_2_SI_NGA_ILE_001 TaxID=3077589 RepID=UPI0028FC0FF4|nr:c-type cytochrome biogenesis protein CcmI [Pseudomonas sp. DTU_2021_1001937_2_SI_NGA_ILE_001]WNW11099.1 c-type cytochrome biogenesis protein CcmI [Pseudomonas sp. DTU_2021_1001937_2_SI_NGA_ILE_001]
MIDFWMAVGLLLLVAASFLLIPVLRHRPSAEAPPRTALNVALYEERLSEMQTQREAGTLSEAQLDTARAEAARELLADTEAVQPGRVSRQLGRRVPLLAALLVPLLALGLYLHYGASARVELAREFAAPPASLEEMTRRLERTVEAQPDSAEGVYFLGRAYMAEQRPADAARQFERAAQLSGRPPELLGQWAQALYFAENKTFTAQVRALTDEALQADPNEVTSLGLLGIAAFEGRRYQEAVDYWTRLQGLLPEGDPSRAALQGGIAKARENLGAQPAATGPRLKVRVELAAAVRDQVRGDDSVFVFVQALGGPPAPLAVRRLSVADLPVQVELSDADAMMPQLKLSNFAQVQLSARVSRAGQPTRGEWLGRSQPLAVDTTALQTLTIDRPDQ